MMWGQEGQSEAVSSQLSHVSHIILPPGLHAFALCLPCLLSQALISWSPSSALLHHHSPASATLLLFNIYCLCCLLCTRILWSSPRSCQSKSIVKRKVKVDPTPPCLYFPELTVPFSWPVPRFLLLLLEMACICLSNLGWTFVLNWACYCTMEFILQGEDVLA